MMCVFGDCRGWARVSFGVLGAGVLVVCLLAGVFVGSASASFGFAGVGVDAVEEGGAPAVQAGSHPYSVSFSFALNSHPVPPGPLGGGGNVEGEVPDGDVKNLEATLPAGLVVNLLNVERCSEEQLAMEVCPSSSQVGVLTGHSGSPPVDDILGNAGQKTETVGVYDVVPSSPDVPGELGLYIQGVGVVLHLTGGVSAGGDGAVSARVSGITQFDHLDGATITLWGDPSAASHDTKRVECSRSSLKVASFCFYGLSASGRYKDITVPRTGRPFLTLPSACGGEGSPVVAGESLFSARGESWQEPGLWTAPVSGSLGVMSGCGELGFSPSIGVQPESAVVDVPTGLGVDLGFPQPEVVGGWAQSAMREAVVSLPAGLVVSPSALNGLGACSEEEIALASPAAPSCPDSSKIGSVEVVSPLLARPLTGWVYLAQQGNGGVGQGSNPFGSLAALYAVIEGPGVLVKVPGEVQLDPVSGRLTVRVGRDPVTGFSLPQLPYSELRVSMFGGPRAALVPLVCGSYTTTTSLVPWSAPASGAAASPQSGFAVSTGCGGGFSPGFSAGTTSNQAGAYSPLVVSLSRRDGEQGLGGVQVRLSQGLLGSIAHVPLCGEPQAREGACGAESLVGSVSAVIGAGADPFSVGGGRAYLTGPYGGAPFGMSIVVPGRAGPFDVGNVVVRAALSIDPRTAAVTVTSGPLPQIVAGVPLQVRSVDVEVDRPRFTFNPTSCAPSVIAGTVESSQGTTAGVSVPFQAAGCAGLAFDPVFVVSTRGAASAKGNGASLDVRVALKGGEANVARAAVTLPRQLPARLSTIQQACTEVVFAANPAGCPAGSDIGVATASSPVLPVMLSGPAYLVSHGGAAFPDVEVVLQGEGVQVVLQGSISIKGGITSSTFAAVPDAPISSFELSLPESPHSALASPGGSLCGKTMLMATTLTAQNGRVFKQSTRIAVTGCPKTKAKARSRARARRARARARRARSQRALAARHASREGGRV
jgi:hypothetical protein